MPTTITLRSSKDSVANSALGHSRFGEILDSAGVPASRSVASMVFCINPYFAIFSPTISRKLRQKSGKFHDGEEKMKRFLQAGALLLAIASLRPITRFVRFCARCAKRRHQEAMIYLAYERELITKAA